MHQPPTLHNLRRTISVRLNRTRVPRNNPIDYVNQNRVFPGDPEGTMSRRVAHVIVLGCTGMMRYSERLAERMKRHDVPVIEPLTSAINLAAALVRLGLRQSKLSYPRPNDKRRILQLARLLSKSGILFPSIMPRNSIN